MSQPLQHQPRAVHLLPETYAPAESLLVSHAACVVFGRDEGALRSETQSVTQSSEFRFSQELVDLLVRKWSDVVKAKGFSATWALSSDTLMAEELCISDR